MEMQQSIIDQIKMGDIFENIDHMVKYYKVVEIKEKQSIWGNHYIVESPQNVGVRLTVHEDDLRKNDGVYGARTGMIPVKVLEAED